MPNPAEERTVTLAAPAPPEPPTAPPPGSGAPAASPPDPDASFRTRLKSDFGVEDPDEVKRWRDRAAQADEYERREQLQRQAAPQYAPQAAPRSGPAIDVEQWRAYARVDPGGAYLQMFQVQSAQQQQQQAAQMAFVEQRIRHAQEHAAAESQAERYVRDEFPEAYNKQSRLHKAGQEVYSSMPWLVNMGNGFQIATQIAASHLGLLPKSKRASSTVTDDEVAAQAPERGTKRVAAAEADDTPLTPRQKKMARDMGVGEKTYKQFQKARRDGKNVRVEH